MATIQSYRISVPEQKLKDLATRLDLTVLLDELDDAQWDYGTPLADVQRLVKYWKNDFDWRKVETRLNESFSHYSTTIEVEGHGPLEIHFVHTKSQKPGAIPLLFSHGWPGSFLEASKIIEPLTAGSPAFDVVAPSLPNFGFSNGSKKRGFAIEQYAEVCHKLMLKLGYERYVTQGGDWGWWVTRTMSTLYPQHCLATHFNMDVADPPSLWQNPILYMQQLFSGTSSRDAKGQKRTSWFYTTGFGYNLLQSTKPQTISYSLNDSPVGLLAWLYEKFHDWSDDYPWTDEEIITWVSVYWFSAAGPGAATRIYYEMMHDQDGNVAEAELARSAATRSTQPEKITRTKLVQFMNNGVKIGFSHFPNDISVLPASWMHTLGKVVFQRDHSRGGHFAAWESPDALVDDLRTMFGNKGGAYGCVPGHSGY